MRQHGGDHWPGLYGQHDPSECDGATLRRGARPTAVSERLF